MAEKPGQYPPAYQPQAPTMYGYSQQPPLGQQPPPGPAGYVPPPPPPGSQPMMQPGYGAAPPGYAPPPFAPGQPPPPGFQSVPVMTGQPGGYPVAVVVQAGPQYSRTSCSVVCPHCQQNVTTRVSYEAGSAAWLICLLIFCLGGGIFCLCLIPFCMSDLQDAHHTCSNCNNEIGVCKRS